MNSISSADVARSYPTEAMLEDSTGSRFIGDPQSDWGHLTRERFEEHDGDKGNHEYEHTPTHDGTCAGDRLLEFGGHAVAGVSRGSQDQGVSPAGQADCNESQYDQQVRGAQPRLPERFVPFAREPKSQENGDAEQRTDPAGVNRNPLVNGSNHAHVPALRNRNEHEIESNREPECEGSNENVSN